MLDKKKLNSIAQKLNVSINFDSDTPGVTVGHGESKKITSFDSLIGYFEKDDKNYDFQYTQYVVANENVKFSSLKNLSEDTRNLYQELKNNTQGSSTCEKFEIAQKITKYSGFTKKTKKISSSSFVTTNINKNSYPNKGLRRVQTAGAQKKIVLAS